MTEEEWFAATDVARLINAVGASVTPRQYRLFMAGWCRRPWDRYSLDVVPPLAEVIERIADGLEGIDYINRKCHWSEYGYRSVWGVRATLMLEPDDTRLDQSVRVFCQAANATPDAGSDQPPSEHAALAILFRDIVGNPFRPVTFSLAWRTTTAVQLARQMYESRDFSAMPILADALQDAGCENDDILSHCRDPQAAHVRGCWVVDLVLGKS